MSTKQPYNEMLSPLTYDPNHQHASYVGNSYSYDWKMLFGRRGSVGGTVVRAGHWGQEMAFSVRTATGQSQELWYGAGPGQQAANDGQWHHWVFFFTATHMGIWLDGQLVMNEAHGITSGDFSAGTPFYLLRETSQANRWLGDVDEFAIYRGVLNQAEILDHYNNGAGKHYAGTGSPSALAVRGAPGGGLTALVARVIAWFGGLLGGAKLAARTPVERGQPAMQTTTPPDGQVWKNYILAGGQRVAVRTYTATTSEVTFLLSDHLGSTRVSVNGDGSLRSEVRYSAYGEARYTSGDTPTNYRYTGQLSQEERNRMI